MLEFKGDPQDRPPVNFCCWQGKDNGKKGPKAFLEIRLGNSLAVSWPQAGSHRVGRSFRRGSPAGPLET